jgi:branched-chain amino acid transport system substrate-binding protein
MNKHFSFLVSGLAIVGASSVAQAQTQGVGKDEVVIGTHLDLSGPAASIGKPYGNGMVMRVEEINAAGGIHGRKLRLIIEDSALDPRKAVSAVQKLVNQDNVFAVVGAMGTAHTIASMPIALRKNVFHLYPSAGSAELYEPTNPLTYGVVPPFSVETGGIVAKLVTEKKASRVCAMYQDDDFGQEVMRGAETSLKSIGMAWTARVTYKRGDTDFSTQMQRLASERCDFVVLGTIIRETVGSITAARRIGFEPTFYATQAAYNDAIPQLGGAGMNGLYASMRQALPRMEDASREAQGWIGKYKTRFGEDPGYGSVLGYVAADIFVRAAIKAGKDLDNQTFNKAMDSLVVPADMFGTPEYSWTPTKRLGSSEFRLSQLQNGRWKVVREYADLK